MVFHVILVRGRRQIKNMVFFNVQWTLRGGGGGLGVDVKIEFF